VFDGKALFAQPADDEVGDLRLVFNNQNANRHGPKDKEGGGSNDFVAILPSAAIGFSIPDDSRH
jgi:hypothetical protein